MRNALHSVMKRNRECVQTAIFGDRSIEIINHISRLNLWKTIFNAPFAFLERKRRAHNIIFLTIFINTTKIQQKTKQRKMKFSTSTITAFALVAVSGLWAIPSSVEARSRSKSGKASKSEGVLAKASKSEGVVAPEMIVMEAKIDFPDFKGTVTILQELGGAQITDAIFEINIEEIDPDICVNCDGCDGTATALNWHIHSSAIPEEPEPGNVCDQIGGHWDPTFGCGGASEFAGPDGVCAMLADLVDGRVNPQTCDPIVDIAMCELGDLSGKVGQTKIEVGPQIFKDNFISNLVNIEGFSIIFHCGAPRVACGNLELVM